MAKDLDLSEFGGAPQLDLTEFQDAPKPSGALRRGVADKAVGFASGAIGATKAIADAAGAGNAVSGALDSANKTVDDYLSPEAKADQQAQQRIMDEAKGKGVWEGIKAGARAFAEAPVQTAVQGLGSIVPVLVGGIAGAPGAVATGIALGAGTAKGAIYDDIKKRSMEAGMSEQEASQRAEAAQEYSGQNADQIALGAGLGVADAMTGVSRIAGNMVRGALKKPVTELATKTVGKAAERGIIGRSAMGMLSEMPLEAAQGGQEQVAANIAAQREGFKADTWEGVASKATLEGLASVGPGGVFGAMDRGAVRKPAPGPVDPTATEQAPAAPGPFDGTPPPPYINTGVLNANGLTPKPPAPVLDTQRLDDMLGTPSQQMGLDPAAGPMSAAAAIAVDTGAGVQAAQAMDEALQDASKDMDPDVAKAWQQYRAESAGMQQDQSGAFQGTQNTGAPDWEAQAAEEERQQGPLQPQPKGMNMDQRKANLAKLKERMLAGRQQKQEPAQAAPREESRNALPQFTTNPQPSTLGTQTTAKAGPGFDASYLPNQGNRNVREATEAIAPSPQQQEAGGKAPVGAAATTAIQSAAPGGSGVQAAGVDGASRGDPAQARNFDFATVEQALTEERDATMNEIEDGWILSGTRRRQTPVERAIESAVNATSLGAENARKVFDVAVQAGRFDVAEYAIQRAENYAKSMGTTPGVSKDSPKYEAIKQDLARRKAEETAQAAALRQDLNAARQASPAVPAARTGAVEAAGVGRAPTPQNIGAQGTPAPGAQAQAPGNANWAALTPEQRRRARLEHEIATRQTNNGGVVASLRPSAIEKRKQELAAMGDAGKLPSPGPAEPLSADGLAAPNQPALDRIASGNAWFGNELKARNWLQKNGLAETHDVTMAKPGRFEVVPKAAKTEQSAPDSASTGLQKGLGEQLAELNAELERQGAVQNASTRARRDAIRKQIAEQDFPDILKAVDENLDVAEELNRAFQYAGDEPKAKTIERILKKRGIMPEYHARWTERLLGPQKPATVKVPQSVADAMAAQMQKQKGRITRLKNEAEKAASLDDKKAAQLKVTAAEATLRKMRTSIFDAEDAAVKSVEAGNTKAFADYADLFPVAAEEIAKLTGQNDELDAEMQSYEAKKNPTYSGAKSSSPAIQDFIDGKRDDVPSIEEVKAETKPTQAPAAPTPAATESVANPDAKAVLSEREKAAKAKMHNALGKLAALASKNTRMNWTQEEEQQLLPIVIELFDGAVELGAVTFEKAVAYVRDFIAQGIDQETADAIPFETLQGAYIAMSGRHKDKGVTPRKEVVAFESLAELENSADQADTSIKDEQNGPTTDTVTGSPGVQDEQPGKLQPDAGTVRRGNAKSNTGNASRGTNENAPPDFVPAAGGLTREGSWYETAKRNIDLIELAIKIDSENRPATPEEQAKLAKYVGFGASAIRNELFPVPPAWAKAQEPSRLIWPQYVRNDRFKPLAERIEALPREWQQSILQSSQYAHYTSEGIIRSVWSALQRMGFNGGQVFEPGMGIGSFSMLMPDAIRALSRYTGVEFDAPTALIARLLSPQQNMLHGDFIKGKYPKNFFDVNVGNPPFSQTKIFGDPEYAKKGFMLHDFFFAKGIDLVRPGGIQVFVTSKGTMDKQTDKARKYLSERADLLGAIRLPSTAFEDNAGTSVVTDVIFLRKRLPGEAPAGESWANTATVETPDGPVVVNEYFAKHPEMVLGQQRISGNVDDQGRRINSNGMGGEKYTVVSYDTTPAELDAKFAKAIEKLPEGAYSEKKATTEKAKDSRVDFDPTVKREGVVYLAKDGTLMRVSEGVGVPLSNTAKLSDKDQAWFKSYVGLRDLVQDARFAQLNDKGWEVALAKLNKAYDKFVKEHGYILDYRVMTRKSTDEEGNIVETESRIPKNRRLLREDYDQALVTSLESIVEDGSIVKSPFLKGRTIGKPVERTVSSIGDALAVSLDETGHFDLVDVGRRLDLDEDATIDALGNQIYQTPSGDWQLADEYLSGDVVAKLEEAEAAARINPDMQRNVAALKEAQPEKLGPAQISAKLGASWIPESHVNAFADEIGAGQVTFDPRTETWQVDGGNKQTGRMAGAEYGTAKRSPSELLEAILNSRSIKITQTVDKKPVPDQEATTAANEMAKKIKDKFKGWVWTDTDRATELVESYNKNFNNIAPRKFDGSHLTLPGVSLRYKLHPHQLRAIWRMVQTGNTYLAHAVGAGKTIEMIAGGMEQKRLGLIKKPMYVVPNHMLEQFSNEFMELYPLANIMVADDENFSPERRKAFIASATLNNPDAIVITHDAFQRIGVKEESVAPIRDEILADLEIELSETAKSNDTRVRRGQLEQQIEAVKQRFDRIISAGSKDSTIKFEDMGVDFVFADEAHVFRKLDFHTAQQIKGIDPNGSKRALDMYVKTRILEQKKPGRSMVFASGTPVTNTMGELYTIMRFFAGAELDKSGISTFDAWARQFGEVAPALEPNAAGKYELIERFAKFDNVPELMSRVRQFMDVLTSDNLGALVKRPDIKGGKPNLNIIPTNSDLTEYMKGELAGRIEMSRAWKPSKDEPHNPDPIVAIITDGRFAAIDPRFFGGKLAEGDKSIITEMGDKVAASYHATKNDVYLDKDGKEEKIKGSTQIVFYNLGFGEQSQKSRGFNSRAAFTKRLTDGGIPRAEIAWFDDANSDAKKEAVFKAMRNGTIKVLIGSAKKMGTGVNVQKRLAVLHYQDPPWFPADVEQPHGRILRQGNQNEEIAIEWYTTKGTYQSTMWQMVGRKQRFIDQAFTGDKTLRSMDDLGEASLFEQAAAVASGDPRAIQLAGLKQDVERFTRLQAAHASEQINVRSALNSAVWQVESGQKAIRTLEKAFKAIGEKYFAFTSGRVNGRDYTKPGEFGQAIKDTFNKVAADSVMGEPVRNKEIASLGDAIKVTMDAYIGKDKKPDGTFDIYVEFGGSSFELANTALMGVDVDAAGLARRIFNKINEVDSALQRRRRELTANETDAIKLRKKLGAPFEYQQEMAEKYGELKRLEAELEAEGKATPVTKTGLVIKADGTANGEAPETSTNVKQTGHPAANETDVVFSRVKFSRAAQGQANGAVEQTVADIVKGWATRPKIVVAFDMNDERIPERVRMEDQKQRSGGATGTPEGFYYKGTVYLMSSKLATADDVARVLFHEALGHHGLRSVFGKKLNSILNRVAMARKAEVDAKMAQYGLKGISKVDRLTAAEEVLAELAQTKPNIGFVREAIAAIRTWLRENVHGFKNLALTDDEIIRSYIIPARNFVERGASGSFSRAAPSLSRDGSARQSDVNSMGFYSALARGIEASTANSAPPMGWKATIKGLVNKGLAKADEVEWSGVNEWLDMQAGKVAKSQVMEFLRGSGVQVQEVELGSADLNTKYDKYTLPGGQNYREVLLTLPKNGADSLSADEANRLAYLKHRKTSGAFDMMGDRPLAQELAALQKRKSGTQYRSSHWDQPNVLAHIRLNDRTDAQGRKVLFVEELQSDWGQEGKKKGFKSSELTEQEQERYEDLLFKSATEGLTASEQVEQQALNERIEARDDPVPSAPFVTNTDKWLNLALKRIVTMAAQEGYDKVAFVNGEQSADRYDLSKQISEINYEPAGEGLYEINAKDMSGKTVLDEDEVTLARIEELVGKEIAKKIEAGEGTKSEGGYRDWHKLSGLDLKVGGEGMKAFYDQIVPAAVKKLVGKLGGKIASVQIGKDRMQVKNLPVNDTDVALHQPGFTITQAMREEVAGGLPIFSRDANGKSRVISKNGFFNAWPQYNEWTRAEYNDVVSLLPPEYRSDPHRQEPIAPEDWDALASAALPDIKALNESTGRGKPFGIDALGNIRADARDGLSTSDILRAANVADKHGLGVFVTGLPFHAMQPLIDAGFVSEAGVGGVLQRVTRSRQAPRPIANGTVNNPAYGVMMGYETRGFPVPMFSRATQWQKFAPLANQSTAKALNDTLVRYGLGQDWSNAYEAVKLPDALSGVRQALQAAFGRDVRAVAPTEAKYNIFNGVYIPNQPNAVYVNVASDTGFINIAGHELWHIIKRQRPELIAWYRQHARKFYKDLPAYRDRLNALVQAGEKPYDLEAAEEELEADFMGDSLTDAAFLQSLADASPSKFTELLNQVRLLLAGIYNKIKGLGSTKEVTDVKALQAYLKDVLVAFADGKPIPESSGVDTTTNESTAPDSGGAMFSRSIGDTLTNATNSARDVNLPAGYKVGDLFNSVPGKLNWWYKTVGTQYHLAQRSKPFKRVYDAVQTFINDVSYYATEAADLAPNILPKLESWKDIAKSPLSAEDTKALSTPVFEGTLSWARDESGKPVKMAVLEEAAAKLTTEQKAQRLLRGDHISQNVLKMWQGLPIDQYEKLIEEKYESDMLKAGIVFTPAELKSLFGLNDKQVSLYQEFRKATDKSLTNLAIADMIRFGGKDVDPIRELVLESKTVGEAAEMLRDYLLSVADDNEVLIDTANKMIDKGDKAQDLMDRGYAPLSRFGTYTLDVVDANGERAYFGMFESAAEASKMRRKMEGLYPGSTITQGTVSEEAYKMFAGVSPETLELFGDMLGLESQGDSAASQAFQEYLKLAKSSRSAMKRLIQRKGIAGFSEDAGRVLAGFVYSNARQTASSLHMGEMTNAANDIDQTQGELKDAAVKLVDYIKNPREEAQALRGLLFAQYIGGSVASAMVNMTQPFTMTFPWLSQYGGAASAAKQMTAAMKDQGKKLTGDAKLDAALRRAEEDGTVSPQEVHQLMQQSQGRGALQSGDGTRAGDALAKANNALSKIGLAWGKLFGVAEQFNRRVTFIAAYRTAVAQGMANPDAFARKAIAETQGVYNKGNKPAWARGAVGSTLFTFKQYSIAYVEMLSRMAKAGAPGSSERAQGQKAALLALGVLFLMSGAGGMPGADDLDDVISGAMQSMGYNFDSKMKRKEFFVSILGEDGARFMERGISGLPGVPIDVSGRLGLGNLLPGTGLFTKKADHTRDVAEIFGPMGDFAKRGFEAAGSLITGDVGKAVNAISPKAVQNLAQAFDMANMGMYRDAKGMKVLDTDAVDAAVKAIGFQPNDVKRAQDANFEAKRMIDLNRINESEIANQWAMGIFEKDTNKVKDARDRLAEWNEANPESPIRINFQQIRSRVQKMNETKSQRIAKTAPKEIRATVRQELGMR